MNKSQTLSMSSPLLLLGGQSEKTPWIRENQKDEEKIVIQPGLAITMQTDHPHELINREVRNAAMCNQKNKTWQDYVATASQPVGPPTENQVRAATVHEIPRRNRHSIMRIGKYWRAIKKNVILITHMFQDLKPTQLLQTKKNKKNVSNVKVTTPPYSD